MAVEINYVVVRKGEKKMTFASKKEAEAWDKMLDMAEVFSDWLAQSDVELNEEQREALGLYLAEQKDAVQHILRSGKLPDITGGDQEQTADAAEKEVSPKKVRAIQAA
ncbi:hypothetical protein PMPD1_2532 [Paramixta manurensis]|uniref:DNA damage-inducible SOS regulon protein n=1 Tax=Paramixta manurensis TaxID=2740817 RepID=A0A6M8UCZ6_9GAMM|nr:hypothetical protein PMPD1_2532 [Erwiniaceae bacterium PD-1]